MDIHASGEDYLEAILILQRQMAQVRSIDVAQYLDVSKPSVCAALKKLENEGCLTKDGRFYIHLTEEGEKIASNVYERHCYFKKALIQAGVEPEIAEHEACQMEHAISPESFDKLKNHKKK